MNVINLTPRNIRIKWDDNIVRNYPPSGRVARVAIQDRITGELDGIPVRYGEMGGITGLPEQEEGTVFIVSSSVLQNSERPDLVTLDTVDATRDEEGDLASIRGWRTAGLKEG